MTKEKIYKSSCPQYLALDVFGDKWTLLIIRDIMIEGKRYFREFLQSQEKIASNVLTNRLKAMEEEGLIYKKQDDNHKQKIKYLLTEKGIDLFPVLMENTRWSLKYKTVNQEDTEKAKFILDGGQEMIESFMDELRKEHLGND